MDACSFGSRRVRGCSALLRRPSCVGDLEGPVRSQLSGLAIGVRRRQSRTSCVVELGGPRRTRLCGGGVSRPELGGRVGNLAFGPLNCERCPTQGVGAIDRGRIAEAVANSGRVGTEAVCLLKLWRQLKMLVLA